MATQWQVGDLMKNRWQIHKILGGQGKSGMGIIYVVYDHEHHEAYAVETFQDEVLRSHPPTADRFRHEALTWVNLDRHQNVTQARFVRTIEGKPYLFLEFVSGVDLGAWIGTTRLTEDLPQVLWFALQFCDGMRHALAKGVAAHRDIKPANCHALQAWQVPGLPDGLQMNNDAAFCGGVQSGAGIWLLGALVLVLRDRTCLHPAASARTQCSHREAQWIVESRLLE